MGIDLSYYEDEFDGEVGTQKMKKSKKFDDGGQKTRSNKENKMTKSKRDQLRPPWKQETISSASL